MLLSTVLDHTGGQPNSGMTGHLTPSVKETLFVTSVPTTAVDLTLWVCVERIEQRNTREWIPVCRMRQSDLRQRL